MRNDTPRPQFEVSCKITTRGGRDATQNERAVWETRRGVRTCDESWGVARAVPPVAGCIDRIHWRYSGRLLRTNGRCDLAARRKNTVNRDNGSLYGRERPVVVSARRPRRRRRVGRPRRIDPPLYRAPAIDHKPIESDQRTIICALLFSPLFNRRLVSIRRRVLRYIPQLR